MIFWNKFESQFLEKLEVAPQKHAWPSCFLLAPYGEGEGQQQVAALLYMSRLILRRATATSLLCALQRSAAATPSASPFLIYRPDTARSTLAYCFRGITLKRRAFSSQRCVFKDGMMTTAAAAALLVLVLLLLHEHKASNQ